MNKAIEKRLENIEYLIERTQNSFLKNQIKLLRFDIELEIQKAQNNGR